MEQYEEVVPVFIVKKLVAQVSREKYYRKGWKLISGVLTFCIVFIVIVVLLVLLAGHALGDFEPRQYSKLSNPFEK